MSWAGLGGGVLLLGVLLLPGVTMDANGLFCAPAVLVMAKSAATSSEVRVRVDGKVMGFLQAYQRPRSLL